MRGILLFLLAPALAAAATDDTAQTVREGIEHFEAGRYDAAATVFRKAGEARPDDPRIAFDRGCAYAAQRDTAAAARMFHQAALARDRSLSARAHYNLGNVVADEARGAFGPEPENAPPPLREEGRKLLARAVGHYRDCLRIEPEHADARHNLELIRMWINHMEEVWKQRDRERNRPEESLLEMLEKIQGRQRELRMQSTSLAAEPDSPERRKAAAAMAASQQSLASELKPLEEKIGESLKNAAPSAAPGKNTASPPEELQRAEQALKAMIGRAAGEMAEAAEALQKGEPVEAGPPQTAAVERLDDLFMAIVPFADLVQKSVEMEKKLIERVEPVVEPPQNREGCDFAETAWDQRFVTRWCEILPEKAKPVLAQAKAAVSQPADAGGSPAASPEAAEFKEQAVAMVASAEKAIEAGPKISKLTEEAAVCLESKQAAEALPKQKEALRLLEEILQSLPKQTESKQQERQKPQGGDEKQPQKDEQEQDRTPQDEPPQDQNQQDQDERKPDDAQQKQKKEEDVSRKDAETMIRQVRTRQQQRREMEKRLQRYLIGPVPVDKDW